MNDCKLFSVFFYIKKQTIKKATLQNAKLLFGDP